MPYLQRLVLKGREAENRSPAMWYAADHAVSGGGSQQDVVVGAVWSNSGKGGGLSAGLGKGLAVRCSD